MRIKIAIVPAHNPITSVAIRITSYCDGSQFESLFTCTSAIPIGKVKELALEDHCREWARNQVKLAINRGEL